MHPDTSGVRRHVLPDADAVAAAAATATARALLEALAHRPRAHVALTGGSTGARTAAALRGKAVDWEAVEVWFGDERFVPVDDDERNDRQLAEALLGHLDPAPLVHRWPSRTAELTDVDEAARRFADALDPAGVPDLDVHLLGMGGEGHVNSVFPDSPAVAAGVADITGVRDCPKPPPERMTFTLPVVRRARHVYFVVAGADKAEAVARAAQDGVPARDLPAAGCRGSESTVWFLDEAAARLL